MVEKTDWERAAEAEGITASERVLARLANKAFLSLWSYSNVFTDEGRSKGKGDGKELCDLLVVFGDSVLFFSDKECKFQDTKDIKVAWPRWYKRAVDKSCRQLVGAEKFARAYPKRIFLDKACQVPLPISLPNPDVAKHYLIAVTRGSQHTAKNYFGGGSSGSVMLANWIFGEQHNEFPFRIGYPVPGRFVHVLDEVTVDLLLEELDTVPDFISYLDCKEQFLQRSDVLVNITGEEELLARYMTTLRNDQHALPEIPDGTEMVLLPEGEWAAYSISPQRAAKRKANEISYMWDALIEYQSKFIRAGNAVTASWTPGELVDHERIVRALASQNRLARRVLSANLRYALSKPERGERFARIYMSGQPPNLAFVFLALAKPTDMDYESYRADRQEMLTVYCHGVKENMPTLSEAIGIASEPFSESVSSQDFIYVDLSLEMDAEEKKLWRDAADELEILRPETEFKLMRDRNQEFPLPFNFEDFDRFTTADGMPMNRAARRRMGSIARRKGRKSK